MIESLRLENLVIVPEAALELSDGFTCITGETGAGKSLLAAAINLLLGGDADASMVGPDGDEAWIEGCFQVPADVWEQAEFDALRELAPADPTELVLARRLYRSGRSRTLAWGRTATREAVATAGRALVSVAGQHGQRRLTDRRHQLAMLDVACGDAGARAATAMRDAWQELRAARTQLAELQEQASKLAEQRADIIDAESRIAEADPSLAEEASLLARRAVVQNRASIQAAIMQALACLDGESGASMQVALAARELERLDTGEVEPVAAELLGLQEGLVETMRSLRARLEEVSEAEADAAAIEERLSVYDELHRRFGGTTEAVLARWQDLRHQRELLGDVEGAMAAAAAAVERAEARATTCAERLTSLRTAAAGTLASAIARELDRLGMDGATVEWQIEPGDLGPGGSDRVQLLLAANPGMAPAPLADIASGGELSRVALALQVATGAHEAPTLVFDEVDAGIGGVTAHAVAGRLAELGRSVQVLCITHLPQVAARADQLVRVEKRAGRTVLEPITDDELVVDELTRMAGGAPGDAAALDHARQMRARRFAADDLEAGTPAAASSARSDR